MAKMSHELRTPMNGIIGMTEVTLATDLDDIQREHVNAINDSAQSLLHLVNDVLDCSCIEAGRVQLEPGNLDLRKLITNTIRAFAFGAHEKGLELLYFIDEDVPDLVRGDATRLRQVLVNLLGNAIKFTKRGEVELRCETELVSIKDVHLNFSIRDTGIGIPEDNQKKIFAAFSQADASISREFGGAGLGLTISSEIVKLMGGDIRVKSTPESGSTFSFSIRVGLAAARSPSTAVAPELALGGKRLLIVDDNEASLHNLERILVGSQSIVEKARDANAALAKLQAARAAGEAFDLLIIDSDMPATDGFALAEKIGSQPGLQRPAIMMLTSRNLAEHAAKCKHLGLTYLLKPVSADQLKEVAAELVWRIERERSQASQSSTPAPAPAGISARRILLAEDNMINQRVALEMLRRSDCEVHVASNGAEALALWKHRTFDLILMDVQMPRIDGMEATRRIREAEAIDERRHTPIVALTANASEEDRERCIAAGMDDYLAKPFRLEQLIEKVRSLAA